jgi:hypothetical protein
MLVFPRTLYIGRLVWNRQRFIKNADAGKRVSRPNPREAWVVQDSAELRIVDQDLWDAAKERQRATKQDPKSGEANKLWEWRRPRCLLSGLTFCGRCAGGYSIISATHVGCSTARNKGTCSNRLTIKRTDLEDRVVGSLKSRLWTRLCSKSFARNLRAR